MPDMATFLTGNSVGISHIFQCILLWFFPLYNNIIVCDNCIEDFYTGNKNILICKFGKKKYITRYCKYSFVLTFSLLFSSLLLNFVVVHLCFWGGKFTPNVSIAHSGLQYFFFEHLSLANLTYIILTSSLFGLLSITGTIIGISIPQRKIVYPCVFLLWFIHVLLNNSIISAIQPFTEYSLYDALPTLSLFILCNLLLISFFLFKEIKYAKI